MAIRQVLLPTTMKTPRILHQMAQHDARSKNTINERRNWFEGIVMDAEADLDEAFGEGYNVKSVNTVETDNYDALHYLLWKKDEGTDTE